MNIMDYINKDKLLRDLLYEKLNNWIKTKYDEIKIKIWHGEYANIDDIKLSQDNHEGIEIKGKHFFNYEMYSVIALLKELEEKK